MFTVKHISPYGAEHIYQFKYVTYYPPMPSEEKTAYIQHPMQNVVDCENELAPVICGKDGVVLENGTVYVMNAAGKTVSVYHLGVCATDNQTSVLERNKHF